MREVARTVEEAGVEPILSAPIARRQDWAYDRGRELTKEQLSTKDLTVLLDALASAGKKKFTTA
jgi:hypothetical protein